MEIFGEYISGGAPGVPVFVKAGLEYVMTPTNTYSSHQLTVSPAIPTTLVGSNDSVIIEGKWGIWYGNNDTASSSVRFDVPALNSDNVLGWQVRMCPATSAGGATNATTHVIGALYKSEGSWGPGDNNNYTAGVGNYFRIEEDGTINAISKSDTSTDGTNTTVIDTGVTIDSSKLSTFACVNDDGEARFYIDRELVAINKTNLPVGTSQDGCRMYVSTYCRGNSVTRGFILTSMKLVLIAD